MVVIPTVAAVIIIICIGICIFFKIRKPKKSVKGELICLNFFIIIKDFAAIVMLQFVWHNV